MSLKKVLRLQIFIIFHLLATNIFAQYPHYFAYDNENGLPSNEVYSIIQDNKGFIWLGCDAGLFRFDGIRYSLFKSKSQNSKSIYNLTISESGIVYAINFQDQIFYIENDSLKELHHSLRYILNIKTNNNELLYVNHSKGISVFDPKNQTWSLINNFNNDGDLTTRSVSVNENNEVYFLSQLGLVKLDKVKLKIFQLTENNEKLASAFFSQCHNNEVYIFSRENNLIYTFCNDEFVKNGSKTLNLALENRKVNGAKSLADGKLWITTYNGIISYDKEKDEAKVFYPDISFSDIIIDKENNYWFSTLQSGLLRVPNLEFLVWNKSHPLIENEQLTRIVSDGMNIYFSTITGNIGILNTFDHSIKTFNSINNSDIESFDFERKTKRLYFHSKYQSYVLQDDKINKMPFTTVALKSILHCPPNYFLASSSGLYLWDNNKTLKISDTWSREIYFDNLNDSLWVATNKGIMIFTLKENQWFCADTLFANTQIISIDYDEINKKVVSISFDGKIYVGRKKVAELPEIFHVQRIKYHQRKIFIATSNGVSIFDLSKETLTILNRISGLISDNIQDILIQNDNIWLATGKGLQRIPLNYSIDPTLGKIFLKNEKLNSTLNFGETLVLFPESNAYASFGQYVYAYRVNKGDWLTLPSSIEQIEIQNLPTGKFEIEIKIIDHLGRDSENIMIIDGKVNPPYWKTWWFITTLIIIVITVVILIVRKIISDIQQREKDKSELLNSQLKAIRSQMNPHFLFNTLNSIQDLILENDIKSTNYYLSKYSMLMRQILSFSEEEKILISEEIEMLENYLELEKLRYGEEFKYIITIDNSIDKKRTFIPSMIVQPFVENAIKHGLLHKIGEKNLSISFYDENAILKILVVDDGIGRRNAQSIKIRNPIAHKSFSTRAVQKRIDLLNKSGNFQIKLNILDNFPNEKNLGTKVEISIINLFQNPQKTDIQA